MDANGVRILFTVWVFVSFMLVLYIVMNKRNKKNYDEVSRSIIEDDDTPHAGGSHTADNAADGAKQ